MNTAAAIPTSSTEALQTPQSAPLPLDLDALRQVVGGASTDAPGGSW